MNILNKTALQGLKNNRTRTFVTIIGVLLSALMITSVLTFGVSLLDYMARGAAAKYGDWHIAFVNVDSDFAEKQALNNQVKDITTFENVGYVKLAEGNPSDKSYGFIAGFNNKTFKKLPLNIISGRLPENPNEILISGKMLNDKGEIYTVGDSVSFNVKNSMDESGSQSIMTYKVVGICQAPPYEKDESPWHAMITVSGDASGAYDSVDASGFNVSDTKDNSNNTSVFVTLNNPRQVHSYVEYAGSNHSLIYNNYVLRFMGLSGGSGDTIIITILTSLAVIVIAIIMIGSIFLIYNSFEISLSERMHQFGILSSVGATPKQLRNSVLFEGLCIGTIGIPLGIIAGLGAIGIVIKVVASKFSSILYSGVPLTLTISPLAIIAAVVVSLITIMISALIPARKAVKTPVMECIRQTNEIKVKSKAMKTSGLAMRLYGLEGVLALKNYKRNKKRYRSIVLSLVLSVVLFVSTSAFVGDMKQAALQTKSVTTYDVGFGTEDMNTDDMIALYDKTKNVSGVTDSSYEVVSQYSCRIDSQVLNGHASSEKTTDLAACIDFIDDAAFEKMIKPLGYSIDDFTVKITDFDKGVTPNLLAVAKLPGGKDAKGIEDLPDLFKDSKVNCTMIPKINGESSESDGKNAALICSQFYFPDIPPTTKSAPQDSYTLEIMAPYSMMASFISHGATADTRVKGITFQSDNPSKSAIEIQKAIDSLNINVPYILLNTNKAFDESRNYMFIANVFAYTFIILISLIAIANVFNTISTNISLRRRELAMLRSVGMPDCDFNKMMRFECAFYGVRALIIGLPLSAVFSWLIYRTMFLGDVENITFQLPWLSILISIIGVLLMIFITMMYAVSKIKKENIIDALRDDML